MSSGGGGSGEGGGGGEGAGDISSNLPYTALPHGASPQRDFAQQRESGHMDTDTADSGERGHWGTWVRGRTQGCWMVQ